MESRIRKEKHRPPLGSVTILMCAANCCALSTHFVFYHMPVQRWSSAVISQRHVERLSTTTLEIIRKSQRTDFWAQTFQEALDLSPPSRWTIPSSLGDESPNVGPCCVFYFLTRFFVRASSSSIVIFLFCQSPWQNVQRFTWESPVGTRRSKYVQVNSTESAQSY